MKKKFALAITMIAVCALTGAFIYDFSMRPAAAMDHRGRDGRVRVAQIETRKYLRLRPRPTIPPEILERRRSEK